MTHTTPNYLIGLDLGKKRDYTALAALRQRPVPTGRQERVQAGFDLRYGTAYELAPIMERRYELLHLDRWRGRSYRDVVPEVQRVLAALHRVAHQDELEATGVGRAIDPDITFLADQTGVGEGVVNDIIRSAGLDVIGIVITGGTVITRAHEEIHVPKRELVGRMEVVVENRRLAIPSAEQLPHADTLVAELDNFQAKTNKLTGNDSYGAGEDWREHNHDDLVLAVAMAVWHGEDRNDAGNYSELDDYERAVFGGR